MNRIISLSVEDMYIKYTGEAFGATGSHNAVTLRMTFGPAWEGTAKTAYFTDALGNASVALVLGLDTLVDGAYEVDVPSEALKTAGVATITIKGVLVSGEITTKAITTAAGHFRVLDSELPDSAGNAGTITPSDKDQLQAEIAGIETLFTTAKAAAEAAAANAKVSETNAKTSETAAASSASSAETSKAAAAESAATATAQASAADASAAKAAVSQKAAQAAETNAKASEKAAAASQASAETASASAQDSASAAAKSAQTAQSAASTATNAASSADQAATAASGSASQASAAATAAAGSAASAETASKTAQSWAAGGTNTRPGEDTDNAKYWAKQAEAVVGGDFATKVEAQGYVTAHNQSVEAHADIRKALNGKEASGTAATAVTAHNKDSTAHADIREALAGKEAAGAAAAVQSNLTAHAGNTTVHVTSAEKTAWDGKASGTHASQHGKDGTDPITPTAIGAVGYDAAQSLTGGQKTQARENIEAAPAGFGLGDAHGLVINANTEGGLNAAVKCGWYYFGGDTPVENAPIGVVNSNYGYLLVCSRDYNNACTQFAFFETQDNIAIRHQSGTTWGPWEYLNPPMALGIEYRTTERYMGKPVYTKLVDCGALPNATRKTVNHGATVEYMLRCAANCTAGYKDSLPYWYGDNDYCTVYASTTQIIFNTPKDLSDRTANAQIWYTKPDT